MRSIFWKTIREIADQEINKDPQMKNAALERLMEDFEERQDTYDYRKDKLLEAQEPHTTSEVLKVLAEDIDSEEKTWLPMHFAMSVPNIDLDDIQILFDNHPEMIVQGSYPSNNWTPCHFAVMMRDPTWL